MPNYAERITEEANALAGAVRLSNATTGAEDTTIVNAVASLIAGYGGGGGDIPEGIKLQIIEYDTTESIPVQTSIPHNLGVVPDLVICALATNAEFEVLSEVEYILIAANYKNKETGYRNFTGLSTNNGTNLTQRYEPNNYASMYTDRTFKAPSYSTSTKLVGPAKYIFIVAAY